MLEKFIFENHLGQRFEGLDNGVFMNYNDLRNYSWSYDTINSRISRFYRQTESRKIPLIVRCDSDEKAVEIKNRLHELAEVDIVALKPGKVYIGDYYIKGFITASTKSDYLISKRLCKIELTLTCEDTTWYREETAIFPRYVEPKVIETEVDLGVNVIITQEMIDAGLYVKWDHVTDDYPTAESFYGYHYITVMNADGYMVDERMVAFKASNVGDIASDEIISELNGWGNNIGPGYELGCQGFSGLTFVTIKKTTEGGTGQDNIIMLGGGTDYPYDYSYDYALSLRGRKIVCNSIAGNAFRLLIYGEAVNPSVVIGGHVYTINGTIGAGETLLIDSISKTITLTTAAGNQINWFDKRSRENYIFEDIPAGQNTVSWSGNFGFDLTVIEKRSEPRWT